MAVIYVENPAGMRSAFKSWEGDVGKNIRRKTEEVRLAAMIEAPGPGKISLNRTGMSWGTGELQSRIRTSYGFTPGGDLESKVTSEAKHSMMVHEGTRPHIITARRPGGWLRFRGRDRGIHYARVVHHPGTIANPFLRRALEQVF